MTARIQQSHIKTPKGVKGERTKELIKDAILKLVHDKGYPNIRLKDICQETGLTVGAFYFHYKDKDKALEEVAMQCVVERLESTLSALDKPELEHQIRAVIESFTRGYADPELIEQTRMIYFMVTNSTDVHDVYFKLRQQIIDHVLRTLATEKKKLGLSTAKDRVTLEYLYAGLADFMSTIYMEKDPALVKAAGSTHVLTRHLVSIWYQALMGK